MKPEEIALSFFDSGLNCSQSVLSAYSEKFGLDVDTAIKASAAFGAGFARLQKTCGAVTGALMVIGLASFDDNDTAGSKELTYQKTKEFIRVFTEKHGDIECRKLLGFDMNTDEGKKIAQENNTYKTQCADYVKSACQLLEDYHLI